MPDQEETTRQTIREEVERIRQAMGKTLPPNQLKGRDFLSVTQFSPEEIINFIWGLTKTFKKVCSTTHLFGSSFMAGKTLLLAIPSALRDSPWILETQIGFTSAMSLLGGVAVPVDASLLQAIKGISCAFEKWADGLAIYGASENQLALLSQELQIPVLNAGDATEMPFEALADLYTIWDRLGSLKEIKIALIGPPHPLRNGLLLAAISFPKMEITVWPGPQDPMESTYLETLHSDAQRNEGSVQAANTPEAAARDARVIYIGPGALESESPMLSWERVAGFRSVIKPGGMLLFGDPFMASSLFKEGDIAQTRSKQMENRMLLRKAVLSLLL